MRLGLISSLATACLCLTCANAIKIDLDSDASVKSAASTIAFGLMKWYTGNYTGDVPGNLPDPYYWWQCGAMFGSMIDYWYYTGDTTYNDVVIQGLLHQVGEDRNFMPTNQTRTLGNDDQAFWGMTAMTAAEVKFKDPPAGQPQWLALAQGVFNSQIPRWNTETCGGGLKWQIFSFNQGYNYKNSVSNGAFFNLAARLAVYTGNKTYADWAVKVWDWEERIGLINPNYDVFDGSNDLLTCTQMDRTQWTYNAGIFLSGAAFMWNLTDGDALWRTRIDGMLNQTLRVFFNDAGVMYEICEAGQKCNHDQFSFKAYLSRWLAATTHIAPFTKAPIMAALRTSAAAAAAQCSGGFDGNQCGARWTETAWDGTTGVGQQMSALEVIQSMLIDETSGLVTNATGGTSVGDPSAGSKRDPTEGQQPSSITTADKAGAGIVTTLVLGSLMGGMWFMLSD